MAAILRALATPERAFGEERTYRVSRVVLLIVLFLLHSVGSELIVRFYTTPYVMGLSAQQRENAAAHFAFGPPRSRNNQGRAAARQVVQPPSPGMQALGVVVQSTSFLFLSQLLWWLLVIFVQFLGGEETKTAEGPHRNSKYLITYSWFPLALRRFAEGCLVQVQDPRAAWSAANLSAYRRASTISFSPLALLEAPSLPGPVTHLVYSLTDPFFLWFLFVIVYGAKSVFRLSMRRAAVIGGFATVMLLVLRLIFSTVGIQAGV